MSNALETLESRRLMTTFTVTSTADSGAGSLRDAITQANATTAADVIHFNISAATKTITLATALPSISQPLTIDGTTQPGYAGTPLIRLTGATAGQNLLVEAAGSVVRGLSLTDSSRGVLVNQANVTIEKCYVGLDQTGALAPNVDGIATSTAANGLKLKYNVISGNTEDGIDLFADNAYIVGNLVGLDPTGLIARGNGASGLRITGGDNLTIGDAGDENRNIFSANLAGIRYITASTGGNIINNYFGIDRTGNVAIPNLSQGITGTAVNSVSIGVPGLGNRFGGSAIDLYSNCNSNVITENVVGIGVDPSITMSGAVGFSVFGTLNQITNNVIGRVNQGVTLHGSNNTVLNNHIGVLPSGQAVAMNNGIWIVSGSSNYVRGNKIANCLASGIKLDAGTNNNFENDTWANGRSYIIEGAANDSLPQPGIQSVVENANGSYTVNTAFVGIPAGTYRVSIYASDQAGHASTGHTQRLVLAGTYNSNGASAQRSYNIAGTPLDKKYITVALTEVTGATTFGSTTEPSPATQANGTPGMLSSSFEYETKHTVRFDFSSVIHSSVSVGDLILRNRDTLQTYTAETLTSFGNSYRWNRTALLPDGRYEAILPAGSVSNSAGASKADMKLDFFVLTGDANHDGNVSFNDLLAVAKNFNGTNKTFSQGDFNYDSKVDFNDLLLLAKNYGNTLFSSEAIIEEAGPQTRRSRSADLLQ